MTVFGIRLDWADGTFLAAVAATLCAGAFALGWIAAAGALALVGGLMLLAAALTLPLLISAIPPESEDEGTGDAL
ncbi:MAG: hypothetical protein ABIR02_08250 [Novosphingobium sp.]